MQHRINCPRTASESISVDILHAYSCNKVGAGLFHILVALFDTPLNVDVLITKVVLDLYLANTHHVDRLSHEQS